MNGLRTRLHLDSTQQKVHNPISHRGDFAVGVGTIVLGFVYLLLRGMGVVA